MKRITLLMLLMAASLHAGICGGNFWVSGEALLWRPSIPTPYYTIVGPAPINVFTDLPKGKQVAVCSGYEGGYKVEVGYRICDIEMRANWASLNTTYCARTTARAGDAVWTTISGPQHSNAYAFPQGIALARQSFNYDVLDGEVGFWYNASCSCFSRRLLVGVRYARVVSRNLVQYLNSSGILQEFRRLHSDNQGTGPRVGADMYWKFWCSFGVHGSLATSLLIGSSKGLYQSEAPQFGAPEPRAVRVRNDATCLIIPAVDIRFGFDYHLPIGCMGTLIGEIGYQVDRYFDGFTNNHYTGEGIASSNLFQSQSFSIDGFYFRLGAAF